MQWRYSQITAYAQNDHPLARLRHSVMRGVQYAGLYFIVSTCQYLNHLLKDSSHFARHQSRHILHDKSLWLKGV